MADVTVGMTIRVRSGHTSGERYRGTVKKVSPTGLRVVLSCPTRVSIQEEQVFYRQRGRDRYVNNPGAGLCGALLNDFFNPLLDIVE